MSSSVYFALEADGIAMSAQLRGNDADDVCEPLPVSLVVVDWDLDFLLAMKCLAHSLNSHLILNDSGPQFRRTTGSGSLKKSAILSQDLSLRIACQVAEGIGGVHYWLVWLLQVANDDGDGAVHRANVNDGVWATPYLKKNAHQIEPSSRIESRVDQGVPNFGA